MTPEGWPRSWFVFRRQPRSTLGASAVPIIDSDAAHIINLHERERQQHVDEIINNLARINKERRDDPYWGTGFSTTQD